MAEVVIKPVRGRDEYVLWSTVTDTPTGHGDRARIVALLVERQRRASRKPGCAPVDRVARADRAGTSAHDGGYGWSETWLVYEGRGLLRRRDLYRAAELAARGRQAQVVRMLSPLGDDY